MKTVLVAILTLVFAVTAYSQQEIKFEDINLHVGDSIKVCTKVYGGKYLEQSKASPTFLNAGANYPDHLLTIVIWGNTRKEMKNPPEEFYKDKQVCITGRIKMYKNKPEIVIYSESQLAIQ